MSKAKKTENCLLVLCLDLRRGIAPDLFGNILRATKAVCVILYDSKHDDAFLQKEAALLVPIIQNEGAAALITDESRIVGRLQADGIHLTGNIGTLTETMERSDQNMIIGLSDIKDRHSAMEIGEMNPDYLMFGKLGADKTPQPHPRNLSLATWWAEIMEIPAIVQAGATLESVEQAASTGAEFVAVEEVIFSSDDPLKAAHESAAIVAQHSLNQKGKTS